jgi:hypothetical protein
MARTLPSSVTVIFIITEWVWISGAAYPDLSSGLARSW